MKNGNLVDGEVKIMSKREFILFSPDGKDKQLMCNAKVFHFFFFYFPQFSNSICYHLFGQCECVCVESETERYRHETKRNISFVIYF